MVGGCETEGAVVSFREAEEATGSGGGGGGGEDEGGGKSSEDKIGGGGNRWPQEETMALLKIRSDMDLVFRKATLKAPLWEQVSRKLGEVGFHRTPKKCKEKFENVYKYHRRTKDGRCRRQTGKAYKFFQQLEALDCVSPPLDATPLPHPHPHPLSSPAATTPSAAGHMGNPMIHPIAAYRVRSNNAAPGGHLHQDTTVTSRSRSTEDTHDDADFAFTPASLSTDGEDTTTLSSSLSGGEKKDPGQGRRRRKRKRKLEALFNRLMKEVVAKQEDLQRQFMDAIDKCETQRRAREEVWKAQELAKLKREQDILAQERAISAAKDAAVMAFLHKMSSSSSHNSFPSELLEPQTQSPPPPPPEERGGAGQKPSAEMTPTTTMAAAVAAATPTSQNNNNNNIIVIDKKENAGGSNSLMFTATAAANNNQIQIQTSPLIMSASAPNSSPRWPKAEVDALIRMRTDMEQRYLENGPKGLLWEEISLKMKKLGYHRSSKKCKEKWENINKYFRRVKDTKRKRGEDAKTCPYFQQLDALYREKDAAAAATVTATCNNNNNTAITVATTSSSSTTTTPLHPASNNPGPHLKPEELLMQMMAQDRPHQMVRPASAHAQEQNANNDDIEGEMSGGDQDDEVAEDDDDADFDDEAQEEEEDGDAYQIVANNNSSSMPVMRC